MPLPSCPGPAVESELQDSHAWQLKLIAQRYHLRSDDAEILGDQWQAPEFSLNRLEEASSVYMTKHRAKPIDAPPVPRGTKGVPVVNRITP